VLGILTLAQAQVIFVDTPGIHQPHHKLGELMVQTAVDTIPDADLILWLVDASRSPTQQDRYIASLIAQHAQGLSVILGLNKSDLVPNQVRQDRARMFLELIQPVDFLFFSATAGENRDQLLETVIAHLPPGPQYYPEDQVTDQTERVIAAELIREQILSRTRQEVPHAVDVIVDEFKERSQTLTFIHATIIVERASQRGILLGRGGKMIKSISQAARKQIQDMVGTQVYLELWVKVQPKWRQKDSDLEGLGYK
jgi:GTP-binding protein Era